MRRQALNPPRLEALLAQAEQVCTHRGARLTKQRREVLELVLSAGEPIGAYALLDRMRARGGSPQPPTIYRALDFLLSHGLVHRVERLQAFIGCADAAPHEHPAQFLLCRQCGRAEELEDRTIAAALAAAAARRGFVPHRATVELEGVCEACAPTGSDTGDNSTSRDAPAHTPRSH